MIRERLIVRDGSGRDINEEIEVEHHCWKCVRIYHYGNQVAEIMFGCPKPDDFKAPYTMELVDDDAYRLEKGYE